MLKMMVGSNLNDVQLQQLVDRTIIKADEDFDGRYPSRNSAKWSKTSMSSKSSLLIADEYLVKSFFKHYVSNLSLFLSFYFIISST